MIQDIRPEDIERESFRIIEEEFFARTGRHPVDFDAREFAILQRVIHATGDFSLTDSIRFHPQAIDRGLAAIRGGRNLYADVGMVAAGIGSKLQSAFCGRVLCRVGDAEVARRARETGRTRSETALEMASGDNVGIVAVGNAPTALLAAIDLVRQGTFAPDLIVGVPVGFVNAAESKELLVAAGIPAITVLGRRGGSPIAAAIVNALLKMA
ncbi:precorrin-8X methylmutase [Desulfoprunum benzoelyticum]|uniref:Precorrin-8X/cobalt-precorrin-8 methylmutase n=1 Tax=Desulfoprunum benzoelyticum TaxID=1506996 RepID=A0A840UPI5_9BACT|nr:precorrin-8X methylmutase [Desulfoprunum benzoelyticum]MBB5346463.1 precorrin-8X/cobalt-precorrin-8 methylmutase [Desulfoprunum benzoelyticum]MBM9528539.1 precorrin-8X methylmutase [Desulfoprunum benzoelyticum]